MKPLILFVALMSASPVTAQQDSIYAYYDMYWKKVEIRSDATYFRVVKDRPDGKYLVRDYYLSGALQFVGICNALEPKLDIEGEGTLYHESGGVQQVGQFKDEKAVGLHKYYYENGAPHKVIFHGEEHKEIYHQFWSPEGEPVLVNGNGVAVEYYTGRPAQYREIRDSVLVASFSDDEDGDRIYTMVQKLPEYQGGYEALAKDLRANLKYPKSARRQGLDGTVYVAFIVSDKGQVADAYVIKGLHPECDAAALEAVNNLGKWNPGMHDDQPVFVKYVLPIKFRLN